MRWFAFNTGKAPLDNIWLRKASTTRSTGEIIQAIYQGKASPERVLFTGVVSLVRFQWYEYDPARDALQAGKPNGFSLRPPYNDNARQEAN